MLCHKTCCYNLIRGNGVSLKKKYLPLAVAMAHHGWTQLSLLQMPAQPVVPVGELAPPFWLFLRFCPTVLNYRSFCWISNEKKISKYAYFDFDNKSTLKMFDLLLIFDNYLFFSFFKYSIINFIKMYTTQRLRKSWRIRWSDPEKRSHWQRKFDRKYREVGINKTRSRTFTCFFSILMCIKWPERFTHKVVIRSNTSAWKQRTKEKSRAISADERTGINTKRRS